jgi:serine/threonine protein kinase
MYDENKSILAIHNSLVYLLNNGIIPMNEHNVFHCDVKDTNILIDKKNNSRLIDWGFVVIKENTRIPDILKRRPFQFNIPFSVILLSGDNKEKPKSLDNRAYAEKIVQRYKETPGHYDYITYLMCLLNNETDKTVAEEKYTYPIIVDYILDILDRFTHNDVFDAVEYYNKEFIHNVDLWGFIVTFIPLLKNNNLFTDLFKKHLFKSGKIDTNELNTDLEKIKKDISNETM